MTINRDKIEADPELFRDLIKKSNDAIFVADPQSSLFIFVNEKACASLGYDRDELLKTGFPDIQTAFPDGLTWPTLVHNLRQSGAHLLEGVHKRKDGTTFPVELNMSLGALKGKEYVVAIARDISERKRDSEVVTQSEERFRKIFEEGPIGMIIVDEDVRIRKANKAFCAMLGYTEEELMGKSIMDFTLKEDKGASREASRLLLKGKLQSFRLEKRYRRKNGEVVWANLTATIIRTGESETFNGLGMIEDITEHKQADERIRALAAVIQKMPDAVCSMDLQGIMTSWNEGAEKMLGYKAEEVMGKPVITILPSEIADQELNHCITLLNDLGSFSKYESLRLAKDGSTVPVEITAVALKNEKGNISGYSSIMRDISERKTAEGALKLSEKKFRDLLEGIQLLAAILDRDGNVTFCNSFLLGLTGWAQDEVLHNSWLDLFVPEEAADQARAVLDSLLSGHIEHLHYENPLKTRDGNKKLIVWDNTVLYDAAGKITGTAGIGIDVTEHRILEAQLLQSQKLEAIGQLSGGVAHDFNNILSTIVGYANLAEAKLRKDDPLKEYTAEILRAAERAANLTQSLLSFSRKRIINRRAVNLNEIVSGVRKFLLRLIREDIEITTLCSESELTVLADSSQVEQMIMNLITNARDAMPRGGNILIRTDSVLMDEEFIGAHGYGKEGRYALILVADTGEGMDAATSKRIFEPFFTTKEAGKGTGLGLSMVYGAVKQHEGFVDLYSEPGKGTIFKIYLPIFKGPAAEQKAPEKPGIQGGSETILVAEDDPALRKLYSAILGNRGYNVVTAADGEDAVIKFASYGEKIRLAILDGIMPKKNGKEVFDELRIMNPDIKAIFVSGYAEDILSKEGLLEPGINFILKPVIPSRLLRRVRELLDS